MKQTINVSGFRDAFNAIRPGQFSYEALGALFDYYEEADENMELDVIAICCDWTEYAEDELIEAYADTDELADALSRGETLPVDDVLEYLRNETEVIELNGSYLVVNR